jgi:hypothetical protein
MGYKGTPLSFASAQNLAISNLKIFHGKQRSDEPKFAIKYLLSFARYTNKKIKG